MPRVLVDELTRSSLLIYSILLLALQLVHACLAAPLLGWSGVARSTWLPVVGFMAFPALIAVGGRVEPWIGRRRRDLSRVTFVAAWALAYLAAAEFFRGGAAHDLDLMFDGSHGRFCGEDGYWLDRTTLPPILFGLVPPLWWMTLKGKNDSEDLRRRTHIS